MPADLHLHSSFPSVFLSFTMFNFCIWILSCNQLWDTWEVFSHFDNFVSCTLKSQLPSEFKSFTPRECSFHVLQSISKSKFPLFFFFLFFLFVFFHKCCWIFPILLLKLMRNASQPPSSVSLALLLLGILDWRWCGTLPSFKIEYYIL